MPFEICANRLAYNRPRSGPFHIFPKVGVFYLERRMGSASPCRERYSSLLARKRRAFSSTKTDLAYEKDVIAEAQ